MGKQKVYYFIGNSDNHIHKTDDITNIKINGNGSSVEIEILSDENEVIDTVNGYETLGDLYESMSTSNDTE